MLGSGIKISDDDQKNYFWKNTKKATAGITPTVARHFD